MFDIFIIYKKQYFRDYVIEIVKLEAKMMFTS